MRLLYYLFITLIFFSCSKNVQLIFEENNGGLFLPKGFKSLVVHDGSLYISDSKRGKIWKVLYTADKASFSDENLKEMELREYLPHIKTPTEFEDIVK